MRKLNPQDLFKFIPLETSTRSRLIDEYQYMDDGIKLELLRMGYDSKYELMEKMGIVKHQIFSTEIQQGKRPAVIKKKRPPSPPLEPGMVILIHAENEDYIEIDLDDQVEYAVEDDICNFLDEKISYEQLLAGIPEEEIEEMMEENEDKATTWLDEWDSRCLILIEELKTGTAYLRERTTTTEKISNILADLKSSTPKTSLNNELNETHQKEPAVIENSLEILAELIESVNSSLTSENFGYLDASDSQKLFLEFQKSAKRANNIAINVFGKSNPYSNRIEKYFTFDIHDSKGYFQQYVYLSDNYGEEFWLALKACITNLLVSMNDEIKLAKKPQEIISMTKNEIKIGNGTIIHGDFVVADSIKDSFNKTTEMEVSQEIQEILSSLTKAVSQMSQNLPQETATQIIHDLEILKTESTSKAPRRQWLELSADGLRQAAINIGEIGKPVLELVARIIPLVRL